MPNGPLMPIVRAAVDHATTFLRFGIAGAIVTVVHVVIFALAIEIGHVPPVPANAAAFVVACIVGFNLHGRWTFRASGARTRRVGLYLLVALVGLSLNSALMYAAVDIAHWSPYVGVLLAIVITPLVTYTLSRYWVFA